jgi:cell division transport system permease protein
MMVPLRALAYFLEEPLISLWRSRLINALSIGTIAVSLFVLGAFLTVASNLNEVVDRWTRKVRVTFFLADALEPHIRDSLVNRLQEDPAVESVELVTREQALERFRTLFRDLRTLPDDLGENPFPASLEVALRSARQSPDEVRRLVREFEKAPGVQEVQYDLLWIQRLSTAARLVRGVGALLGGILVLAGVFTISNVIRLTVYARQDELDIMRLVGATRGYVKGPFVVEGMLQGGLGGLVSVGLLWLAFRVLASDALAASDLMGRAVVFLPRQLCVLIVAGGMLVGIVGSLVSLGRTRVSAASAAAPCRAGAQRGARYPPNRLLKLVGLALHEEAKLLPPQLPHLLPDALEVLRLEPVEVHGHVFLELAKLLGESRRSEVARHVGQVLHLVGEGGLRDDGPEVAGRVHHVPEAFGRSGVAGERDGRLLVLHDETGGRHDVGDVHRPEGEPVDGERLLGGDLDQLQHRCEIVGKAREVGPREVVEQVVPHGSHHFGDGVDAERESRRAEVVVDEERQRAGVVEVRMGDEDVLHLDLLLQGKRARHPAGVERHRIVDQERSHPVSGDVPSIAAEDLKLHRRPVAPSSSFYDVWRGGPRRR